MSQKIIFGFISLISIFLYSLTSPDVANYSLIGLFLFLNVGYDFFIQLGKSIPIKQLILLIALLQWVVAPFFSYHYFTGSEFYYMQIPEEEYMSYVVPAVLLFILGFSFPLYVKKENFFQKSFLIFAKEHSSMIKRGQFLFWFGMFCLIVSPFVPGSLGFAFFLLNKLTFVGAFYLFAANARFGIFYLIAAYIPVVLGGIHSSVFHDLLLWGYFLFIVYALVKQIGVFRKTIIILGGICLILFIQLIKQQFREVLATTGEANIETITDVANQRLNSDIDDENYFQALVDRFNQGWIIARIMYVVPQYEPFAEGETIRDGLIAAAVPRFFNPNKVKSGGAYFERFTGIALNGASMNLSILGEAYANYGLNGGMFFMFIFGLFLNLVLVVIYYRSNRLPELLLWIPFLFLYTIKAEDDFTTMINQFTKALVVMIGIFWLIKYLYPKEKINEEKNSLGSKPESRSGK